MWHLRDSMHASRVRTLISLGAVSAFLNAAAPATAQAPTPTPAAPAPAPPAPAPTVAPPVPTPTPAGAVAGKLAVSFKAPYRDKGHRVALRGDRVAVRGALSPAVPGQRAIVELTHGHRTLARRHVTIGPDGAFGLRLRLRGTGTLAVRALHKPTGELQAARSRAARVVVLSPRLHFGSHGALVRLFTRALDRLRYPVGETGSYDAATGRAVMAYRKVNSLRRLQTPSGAIVRRVLSGRGGYHVRHPTTGHHVEVDLSRQIVALVDGDRLVRVYPTSSGKSSTPTVRGAFRFYSKTPGTNAKGMLDSNYFVGGYAIHGYPDVPAYNASHGCLRIPNANAAAVYGWIRLSDRIFVEP